jgi:DNA-binding transcriptional regulator YiaG
MKPEELEEIRNKLELTREQLATSLGISIRTLDGWRNGSWEIPLPVQKLLRVMAILDPRA